MRQASNTPVESSGRQQKTSRSNVSSVTRGSCLDGLGEFRTQPNDKVRCFAMQACKALLPARQECFKSPTNHVTLATINPATELMGFSTAVEGIS